MKREIHPHVEVVSEEKKKKKEEEEGAGKEVPEEVLHPRLAWMRNHGAEAGSRRYSEDVSKLADLFRSNFKTYEDKCTPAVISAGPTWETSVPEKTGAYSLIERSVNVLVYV